MRIPPWLALLLVSPAIGEVLSGSSPPRELINPFAILFTIGLYGCGALLVREIAIRWRKGWPTILALGAAYGIIEEGLMTKSFFDPAWMDVGILGSYGRWLGVNWVWTLELILFHAVFSISIAILLVRLAYPDQRDNPWIGRRGMVASAIVLIFVVAFGYLFMTPYRPDALVYILAIISVAVLMFMASRLPVNESAKSSGRIIKPRWLTVAGFAWTFALFFTVWVLPHTGLPAIADFTLLTALGISGWLALARLYGKRATFSDLHKLALADGAIGFFVLLSVILSLNGMIDMGLAGLITVILLYWLWRRVKSRNPGPAH